MEYCGEFEDANRTESFIITAGRWKAVGAECALKHRQLIDCIKEEEAKEKPR